MTRFIHKFVLSFAIALCLGTVALAQTITGSVTGTVTDPSGAVIKGAKVTVTNVDTGISVSDITNAVGIYNLRFLQIGKYQVLTEAKGFTKTSFGPFQLEIDQTAKVDMKLSVGGDSTKVDVASNSLPLLDTEDSTIATTLTANTIENMPMNGRNWSTLTLFTPGSIATNPSSFGGSGNGNAIERNQFGGGNGQANVNGNRAEGNNYELDGIEINETLNNLVGYNPNPDAIGQLQVISANASAEYGNVNGGDVLAVTKSGTNAYHGSAGIFLEDYLLDANTWANKDVPTGTAFTPRNPYTQTQFSGTFGGPILKDKLFFFVDYFGTRYHKGGLTTASVLTQKMRNGDFSELLDPTIMCSAGGGVCAANGGSGALIQLYDPTNNYAPYANNQIPVSNTVFAYLAAHPQYYPLPNLPAGSNSPVLNNYRGNTQSIIYNNQGDIKVDYTPTAKDRFSARWLQGQAGDFTVNPIALTFPGSNLYPDKGLALDYTRTISSAVVNNLRAGYTRVRWIQGDPTDSTGQFGSNGDKVVGIPAAQAFPGFASQTIQNVSNFTNVGSAAGGTNFIDNTFQYTDTLSWQRGHHLLNFGVSAVRYQQNNFYPGNDGANGQFDFNGVYTSDPSISGASGYALADWALDRSSFSGIGAVTGRTGQRQWRSAYYVQDDWKVRTNLTLNLGLRYEYFQPIYEVNNKQANVNYATQLYEYAGSVPTGAPAGSTVCPTRACVNSTYNNWMPRLGFSYQPLDKLVLRGGFGITKALEGTGANLRLTYNAPFETSFEATGTSPSSSSTGTFLQEKNGFTAPNGQSNPGGFPRTEPANIKPQVTNEYSLTLEYQFNNYSSLTVGYVGELSEHLIQAAEGNQLRASCLINGVAVDPTKSANTASCANTDPAPFLSLVGENGFVFETVTEGAADYNALQAQYRQRAFKGLEFTVNYAYAHAFTNSVGFFGVAGVNGQSPYAQDAYNNHAEWGPAGSDVRHSLNATAVYELPFGRGKEFGSNVNRITDEAIGGWKLSMTALDYSGLPVTISANNVSYVNNNCCASRPNQISDVRVSNHTLNNWFGGIGTSGTGKYAAPAAGTFGNAHVGTERAPGFQQYDFSLFKDFAVWREQKLNFRVDAFNALNMTSLGNPSNNFSSPSNFGQITSVKSVPRQLQISAKYEF